jgi:TolA-binding protein
MNPKVKLVLYVVLLSCMAVLGYGLYSTYHAPSNPAPPQGAATNLTAAGSNLAGSNAPASTNLAVAATEGDEAIVVRKSSPRMGRMMGYGAGMFLCLVGLGLLIGNDLSRFLANRVDDFIFNDNLEGVKDPEYEEAERVWASGQHLDAIQLMRDYLKRHPREQYVALRIAEIYETDLHNYLAAALEYEEVLKKRLPAERWGWAAVHLANLYSGKLNKTEQATVLLRRIADEYGQTAAAKKARERLGLPEPVAVVIPPTPEPEPEPEPKPAPAPPSNLPPGFRPK